MRFPRTFTALLALALLLTTAVGLAVASGSDDQGDAADSARHAKASDREANARQAEKRESHEDARAAHADFKDARKEAKAEFRADHQQIVREWREARSDARESYKENKTRIVEECRATNENRSDAAACVREGLEPLREQYHAAVKDLRVEAKARLIEILEAKIAALRASMGLHERHGGESSDTDANETTETETVEASS